VFLGFEPKVFFIKDNAKSEGGKDQNCWLLLDCPKFSVLDPDPQFAWIHIHLAVLDPDPYRSADPDPGVWKLAKFTNKPVPEFIDPDFGMKTSVFVKNSPKRSFSYQFVPRDASINMFWTRSDWGVVFKYWNCIYLPNL
jgi:hypothetical protein